MRILVAEDHQNTSETYRLMLESEGHDVTVTNNGQDCISMYNEFLNCGKKVDTVILDYRLPLQDGIEIAKHVLSLVPEQRILMASSYPEDVIARSAERLNNNIELLIKPFDIVEFVDVVSKTKMAPLIGARR